MTDNKLGTGPNLENIRTLIYFMGLIIDHKLAVMRQGTPYQHVRASDVRVFIAATSGEKTTISDIARILRISRQSVQKTVQRLVALGVLDLAPIAGNKRDKNVVVTPRGQLARSTGVNQLAALDAQLASVIGKDGLNQFKTLLARLVEANRAELDASAPDA